MNQLIWCWVISYFMRIKFLAKFTMKIWIERERGGKKKSCGFDSLMSFCRIFCFRNNFTPKLKHSKYWDQLSYLLHLQWRTSSASLSLSLPPFQLISFRLFQWSFWLSLEFHYYICTFNGPDSQLIFAFMAVIRGQFRFVPCYLL